MSDISPSFVIDDDPRVEWPVTVLLPVDGGEFAPFRFTGRFKVLAESDWTQLMDESSVADPELALPETLELNAKKFAEVLVGWKDVTRPDGSAVPFTAGALRTQIVGPRGVALSAALWLALSEIRYGARLGNFAPPPVAG